MSYYANDAQKARLSASLVATEMFLTDLQGLVDNDFSPDGFLAMLENVEGELGFLRQYVTHNFLASDGTLASSDDKPDHSFDKSNDGFVLE